MAAVSALTAPTPAIPVEEGEKALEKRCSTCHEVKPVEGFYRGNSKYGRCNECKVCTKERLSHRSEERKEYAWLWGLKNKFGMTKQDYLDLLETQGGTCAICNRTCKSGIKLAVDHCHKTGRIRGLLCRNCNVALGHLADDPGRLRAAAAYLEG